MYLIIYHIHPYKVQCPLTPTTTWLCHSTQTMHTIELWPKNNDATQKKMLYHVIFHCFMSYFIQTCLDWSLQVLVLKIKFIFYQHRVSLNVFYLYEKSVVTGITAVHVLLSHFKIHHLGSCLLAGYCRDLYFYHGVTKWFITWQRLYFMDQNGLTYQFQLKCFVRVAYNWYDWILTMFWCSYELTDRYPYPPDYPLFDTHCAFSLPVGPFLVMCAHV